MMTILRATERKYKQVREQQVWFTFHPQDRPESPGQRFAALETLKESRLLPQKRSRNPPRGIELLTYVREGSLAYEDSTGQTGIIRAGEFQRVTAGMSIRYSQISSSCGSGVHVFQIRLCPTAGHQEPSHERKRFSTAHRRGALCVVASQDARQGSLRLHHDATVYSAILECGQHIVHALRCGRAGWLHVVEGEVNIQGTVLATGDGAGVSAELSISFAALKPSEVLLVDLVATDCSPDDER